MFKFLSNSIFHLSYLIEKKRISSIGYSLRPFGAMKFHAVFPMRTIAQPYINTVHKQSFFTISILVCSIHLKTIKNHGQKQCRILTNIRITAE